MARYRRSAAAVTVTATTAVTVTLAAGLLAAAPAAAQSAIEAEEEFVDTNTAVLRALDKQMGRISEMTVRVGDTTRFYGLHVTVQACRITPVSTTPHEAAFLEIRDESSWGETVPKIGDGPDAPIYSGWMFASSPSLTGLEHPVYDIWVKSCEDRPEDAVQEAMVLPTRKPDIID
ncbi:DUF2155 domain-containing protein [Caenispirillum bisanense]|uniref:DUF2155 domain-containing protein n=1 Tax=Caenispirillum bisanense TaxID=414052 RepID=UPI0031DC3006